MESLHAATRAKAGAHGDALQSAEEREAAAEMAQQAVAGAAIHRLWQMLLKGLQDVAIAPDPREAAEMALLRLIHAADMPDPAALLARLSGEGQRPRRRSSCAQGRPGRWRSFPPISRRWSSASKAAASTSLAVQLHDQVGLVRYAPPELVLKPTAAARRRLAARAGRRAQVADRHQLAGVACPTRPASRRCSTRRKWPRSAFAPKCWPIPTSAR